MSEFAVLMKIIVLAGLCVGMTALAATSLQASNPAPNLGWERSANIGATVTRGNSKTLLFTARIPPRCNR